MTERPYRPGVGMMLLNAQREIFVACRIDSTAEAWQMPQGGIDAGEEPMDAAWREMEEEIGTRRAVLLAESREWLTYDLPENLQKKLWGGRFRGQKQKWFCFRFEGADFDINLATAHPEFSAWKWVAPRAVPELIVPFKRALYQELLNEFAAQLG